MIPISFLCSIILFALMQKTPLNRATSWIVGIKYMLIPKESLNKYSKPDKQVLSQKNKQTKSLDIIYLKRKIVKEDLLGMPYTNDLIYLWSSFLAGVGSLLVCISLGFLGIAAVQNEVNNFIAVAFGFFFVFLRFGIVSSFNRAMHRRFAVAYGLLFSVLSFLILRRVGLGIFEFRPSLLLYLEMPQLFLDLIISVLLGILGYSLSTPMLYELFAYQMIKKKPAAIIPFDFASKYYNKRIPSLRRTTTSIFTFTPLVPLLIMVSSRFLTMDHSDLIFSIIFFAIEVVFAILKLKSVKVKAQILTFNSYKGVIEYNYYRTYDFGKQALANLNRALLMVPVSEVALSIHPMMAIFFATAFASSFVMTGLTSIILRHTSLFLMTAIDFILAGYRIFNLFMTIE
ncbi:hypothetical protein TRFO_15191 [Tritrichomonas foetus]|uniref:Uncharacterized protein n=1 Tax=Tritrichomonas foetus TaxID=1144522 RepID=A0A1J4KXI1_9EUKA|nr:hypothetical protein TRFO_15191 [Tritrichomonas foetus]|eukprot:OHT14414.1 hypothetical protein TRFO_15191 [Tritrichomonas foetus]